MENIINMEAIGRIPQTVYGDIKSAAKTVLLTRKIRSEMEKGADIESVLAGYLPAADPDRIQEAAKQLTAGVDSVYAAMDEEVDGKWISKHLNNALVNLNDDDRVAYLTNLAELAPAGSIDEDTRAKIELIKGYGIAIEEDVEFLVNVVQNALAGNAGILKRSSVMAMDNAMQHLPKETVNELAAAGVDTAMAYAAACYIMNQCGENPWSATRDIGEQMPYTVGVIAATNIESSRLMTLYYTGKVKLTVLHEKLEKLYRSAVTFVCEHAVRAIAVGLQIMDGVSLAMLIVYFLYYVLHFGPWVSIIGAVALATFTVTRLVTTQDFVDGLNMVWDLVKSAWNTVKNAWNAVFQEKASVEFEVDAANDVEVDAAGEILTEDIDIEEAGDDEIEDIIEDDSEDEDDDEPEEDEVY